jgi:hypothetical protein
MSILDFFKAGEQVAKPIDAVANGLDKLFTSDDERLTKTELLERTKQQPDIMLNELDKIYAASDDKFSKRARPFCVYVAGVNAFQLGVAVIWFGKHNIPEWFITMSTTGFLGALGLYGAMRTIDKLAGKAK